MKVRRSSDIDELIATVWAEESTYEAIHAAIDLISSLQFTAIDEIVLLLVPSGNISTHMFDICCEALRITTQAHYTKYTLDPNEVSKTL